MSRENKLQQDLLKADGIDPAGPTDSEWVVLREMLDGQLRTKKSKPEIASRIGRLIMKSKMTQLATASVILVAVFIGINHFGGSIDGTSIVWADVVKQLEKVSTFRAQSHRVFEELVEDGRIASFEGIRNFSQDHGFMEEMTIDGQLGMLTYANWSDNVLVTVFPQIKQYYRFAIDDEILSILTFLDPANSEGVMKLFGSERCTRLGHREIEGMTAEGFEVKDIKVLSKVPEFLFQLESVDMRIWINQENLLPVELETNAHIGKGLLTGFKDIRARDVVNQIEYDVDIDEGTLAPNIPDDYTFIDTTTLPEKARGVTE